MLETNQAAPATTTAVESVSQPQPGDAQAKPVEAQTVVLEGVKPEQEQKPAEAKPVVPEKYDLKLPEGSKLDPARIENISLYAKEKGLSNEQAQEILNRENEALASFVDAQQKHLKEVQSTWVESAKTDKEIGGLEFKKNVELSHRVLKKFATEEFLDVLDNTQYGNHPELIRTFSRIAKAMSEDQLIIPNTVTEGMKDPAEILYGSKT